MQVKLNKSFVLNGSVGETWNQLKDVVEVAGCMPGAEITEITDITGFRIEDVTDTTDLSEITEPASMKGKVTVKLGPVTVKFKGEIEVLDIDEEEHQIHLVATGKDSKGSSTAGMDLTARIDSGESNQSILSGDATVTVNGKLASFGGRMMTQVGDQMLNQFADNFSKIIVRPITEQEASVQKRSISATQENEINGFKLAYNALIGFIKSFFGRTTQG